MNPSSPRNGTCRPLLGLALLALPCGVRAVEPTLSSSRGSYARGSTAPQKPFPSTSPSKPTREEGKKWLALLHAQKVCKAPLDLKVEKATLEEIAAQVAKQIPAPVPRIEVRGAQPIRFSFALKNSTVGEALETMGMFAGAKLWVLSDRLLLAPQTSLTENDARVLFGPSNMQWVFSSLIANEINAKVNAKGKLEANGLLPYGKTTFNALSPEGKQMLQGLVDQMVERLRKETGSNPSSSVIELQKPLVLSSTTVVALNEYPGSNPDGSLSNVLSIHEGNRTIKWNTNGKVSGTWFSAVPPRLSPDGSPPFIDISAQKS